MKKRNILLGAVIILAVIVLGVLAGLFLKGDKNQQSADVRLYFMNEAGTSIVVEQRSIRYDTPVDLPIKILEQLAKGPGEGKKMRIMDPAVRVNMVTYGDNRTMTMDLSANFLTGNTSRDILSTYAVIKSICGAGPVFQVSRVKLTVEGRDIIAPDGSVVGYLSDEDINLATDQENGESRVISLYFAAKDSSSLVKERRSIKVPDKQPLEQYIINELIKGPLDASLNPVLSSESALISVETADGVCFVNFKSGFKDKNTGSEQKEKLALYAIVNSLTELDEVNSVQFLIDGKKTEQFGSIHIGDVLKRSESIIRK